MERFALMLLNLGGPDNIQAVRPFLYNLFSDREIIPLGPPFMQKPLALLISLFRTPKTKRAYTLIGGGSPIREITEAQANLVTETLSDKFDIEGFIGMRYWHPFIDETMREISRRGHNRVVGLSLYPQFSYATTGSTERVFRNSAKELNLSISCIRSWHDHPLYIQAITELISNTLEEMPPHTHLLFSAHSLPVTFIEEMGDPYRDQIEETVSLVIKALREKGIHVQYHLSYQSRSGPVRWLSPSTDEMIHKLATEGVKEVLTVPISFVSDHIETLYEIDILYKEMASQWGVTLRRIPSLNTYPTFIRALCSIVEEHLQRG